MVAQNLPVLLTGIFLGARRSCDGFFHPQPTSISSLISNPTRAAARAARGYGYGDGRQDDRVGNDGGANQHTSRLVSKARPGGVSTGGWSKRGKGARLRAVGGGQGFGSSTPNPSAYYPDDEEEDEEEVEMNQEELRKVKEFVPINATPKGIGTLFERGDEVIRELSSEEYTDVLRDWAPLASFAASEALDPEIKKTAECIRNVLRGMAEWQPKRNSDYTKLDSKWAFGAPIGAIKEGMVDAMACIQVSEEGGVVIEWICGNPATLGVPGNAVDWLAKGVYAICGKKLDLPVTIARRAKGEFGSGGGKKDSGSKKSKKKRQ